VTTTIYPSLSVLSIQARLVGLFDLSVTGRIESLARSRFAHRADIMAGAENDKFIDTADIKRLLISKPFLDLQFQKADISEAVFC
ncbi:MAG: hypothetical protein V7629_14115, partial [Motiliproteus sp.]